MMHFSHGSYHFSVFDVVSDMILFISYLEVQTMIKTVSLPNDESILHSKARNCTLVLETEDGYQFSCEEYNPMFAALTLLYIYLPSLNVIATLYGPRTAGLIGVVWGVISFGVSTFLGFYFGMSLGGGWIAWFLFYLGLPVICLGSSMIFTHQKKILHKSFSKIKILFSLHLIFLPLLIPFSPFIFLFIKWLGVCKPNNELIKLQSTVGTKGEAILEAGPQIFLQCFIVLSTLSPDWKQMLSIITSSLSLSLPNIEHFVTAKLEEKSRRNKETYEMKLKIRMEYSKTPCVNSKATSSDKTEMFQDILTKIEQSSDELTFELSSINIKPHFQTETYGPKSILKHFLVFFSSSLFRILAVAILAVFFKVWTPVLIFCFCLMLLVCLLATALCYKVTREKNWRQLLWECSECSVLSWLTITNLGRGNTAAVFRMVSSVFWTISHTISLGFLLVFFNMGPSKFDTFGFGEYLRPYLSGLALVQHLPTLNILLISIISLGWLSLDLDIITAAIKNHYRQNDNNAEDQENKASFWDGAILFEGMKIKYDFG